MPKVEENICCLEISKIVGEIEDKIKIIGSSKIESQHDPGFSSVCLEVDRHVLKAAYHAYRQDYGTNMPNNTE